MIAGFIDPETANYWGFAGALQNILIFQFPDVESSWSFSFLSVDFGPWSSSISWQAC
jgi:hypothetical protein